MTEYSERFRRKMVQRLTGPYAVSGTVLGQEVGVSQAPLSRWLGDAGTLDEVTRRKNRKARQAVHASRRSGRAAALESARGSNARAEAALGDGGEPPPSRRARRAAASRGPSRA